MSYCLAQRGLSQRVLERGRIGETWRTQRWDSFHINTPRSQTVMPGQRYSGSDPDGAMPCAEFVSLLEGYAQEQRLPVETGAAVTELATAPDGHFRITTPRETLHAANVVIASGHLNCAVRPALGKNIPKHVRQMDTCDYRNADALAPGAILVVGSAQSGGQIAEDLAEQGRKVFLATSRIGRGPRLYRGKHIMSWMVLTGMIDITRAEMLSQGRIASRPLHGSRHTISLQSLSNKGVVLLGKLNGYDEDKKVLTFDNDLRENLRFADESSSQTKLKIDSYIERMGLDAPPAEPDPAEVVAARVTEPPILSLDPVFEGITSVIWCTGFRGDFKWARVPGLLDTAGHPVHVAGVSSIPGIVFAGLDFAVSRRSGTILAIAEEADRVAALIEARCNGRNWTSDTR